MTRGPRDPDPDSLEGRLRALAGEDGGGAWRAAVVEAFGRQGSRDLETLRQALARSDGPAAAAAAHSLAGSAAILRATALAGIAGEVEVLARQGDLASCASRLAALERELRAAQGELSAFAFAPSPGVCPIPNKR